jgi:penicillin-binding protein 1B
VNQVVKQRARAEWLEFKVFLRRPAGLALIAGLAALLWGSAALAFYYNRYARLIDRKLASGPFAGAANIYAAPRVLEAGETLAEADLLADLRGGGYAAAPGARAGWFRQTPQGVEIYPPRREGVRVEFGRKTIRNIVALESGAPLDHYQLEPQLIANVSPNRQKRRLVRFAEIPKVLVQAVLSAEDKRFFEHSGFDSLRMLKAAWVDLKSGHKEQGASTITMQLARSLWLDPSKNWRRKLEEMLITDHLEQKLTKQQIFEDYANQVYLGRRGAYSIHGFGEAARVYFGKDIRQLALSEAAMLAGLVQRPGYYDPLRSADRTRARRNLVLLLMRQNGYITGAEYDAAAAAPVQLAPSGPPTPDGDAPCFMDMLRGQIQSEFQERDVETRDVYTTLDPDLQRDAVAAVEAGLAQLDARLKGSRAARKKPLARPQAALIALDPATGEVRALVGGRDYAASQLNRVLAQRQPGSAFKPFVYAAALDTALTRGSKQVFTPSSIVADEPTTFWFNNQAYEPRNYGGESGGDVSLRDALSHSLNIPSVEVAQAVGYDKVTALARQAGLEGEQATPAVALGAYDVTPLDLAGAYTVFANQGVYVRPTMISLVRSAAGRAVYTHTPQTRRVLDPRVAYLMVNMMQDVLSSGTGASVRAQGFTAPAAGKTGTSRDGWFAGFTTRLLCVVWVGYDDGRDMKMEAARSALPLWTEFMRRASKNPRYGNSPDFPVPEGLTTAEIDPGAGMLATARCPQSRTEFFIQGTQPVIECLLHPALLSASSQ